MKTSIFSETWGIVTRIRYTKQSGLRLSGTSSKITITECVKSVCRQLVNGRPVDEGTNMI